MALIRYAATVGGLTMVSRLFGYMSGMSVGDKGHHMNKMQYRVPLTSTSI